MTIDDPVEIEAVVADDAMVERLRSALSPEDAVVWDDDDDVEDLSYQLLRALQRDVSGDVELGPLPAPVPLRAPRRVFGRTATVAVVAAGVLTVAGAAAAATSSSGPLHGVGSAVSSAVHDAIDAIAPSKPVGPESTAGSPSSLLTPGAPAASAPGTQVSAAARSASAALQIDERLSLAARLIDAGRATAAGHVLDQAESKLPLVSDVAKRSDFQQQIDALRAKIAALPQAPHGKPTDTPGQGPAASHKPTAKPSHSAAPGHASSTARPTPQPSRPAQPGTKSEPLRPSLPAPAQSAQNR